MQRNGKKGGRGAEIIAQTQGRLTRAESRNMENDLLQRDPEESKAGYQAWAVIGCYSLAACIQIRLSTKADVKGLPGWPWKKRMWKPSVDDPVQNLAKAGALIAEAIDDILVEREKNNG